MRVPVVNGLGCELDVWEVNEEDGSLYFEVHDHGPPDGRVAGAVLIARTIASGKWHWETR